MGIPEIISLFSGVALFLFGMSLMGEGLKKVSGDKLEPILFKVSGTQLKGVLFGTGVTAVIQSSAATSVMAVGFVNSGIMKLRQAISVIIGSILGTSITGWVICLSYIDGTEGIASLLSTKTLTGLAAVIGILLRMFSKKRTGLYTGNILMGFSILMFGMSTMSGSVSALGKAPWFLNLLTSMRNPVLGILVGVAITAMLQSASAVRIRCGRYPAGLVPVRCHDAGLRAASADGRCDWRFRAGPLIRHRRQCERQTGCSGLSGSICCGRYGLLPGLLSRKCHSAFWLYEQCHESFQYGCSELFPAPGHDHCPDASYGPD